MNPEINVLLESLLNEAGRRNKGHSRKRKLNGKYNGIELSDSVRPVLLSDDSSRIHVPVVMNKAERSECTESNYKGSPSSHTNPNAENHESCALNENDQDRLLGKSIEWETDTDTTVNDSAEGIRGEVLRGDVRQSGVVFGGDKYTSAVCAVGLVNTAVKSGGLAVNAECKLTEGSYVVGALPSDGGAAAGDWNAVMDTGESNTQPIPPPSNGRITVLGLVDRDVGQGEESTGALPVLCPKPVTAAMPDPNPPPFIPEEASSAEPAQESSHILRRRELLLRLEKQYISVTDWDRGMGLMEGMLEAPGVPSDENIGPRASAAENGAPGQSRELASSPLRPNSNVFVVTTERLSIRPKSVSVVRKHKTRKPETRVSDAQPQDNGQMSPSATDGIREQEQELKGIMEESNAPVTDDGGAEERGEAQEPVKSDTARVQLQGAPFVSEGRLGVEALSGVVGHVFMVKSDRRVGGIAVVKCHVMRGDYIRTLCCGGGSGYRGPAKSSVKLEAKVDNKDRDRDSAHVHSTVENVTACAPFVVVLKAFIPFSVRVHSVAGVVLSPDHSKILLSTNTRFVYLLSSYDLDVLCTVGTFVSRPNHRSIEQKTCDVGFIQLRKRDWIAISGDSVAGGETGADSDWYSARNRNVLFPEEEAECPFYVATNVRKLCGRVHGVRGDVTLWSYDTDGGVSRSHLGYGAGEEEGDEEAEEAAEVPRVGCTRRPGYRAARRADKRVGTLPLPASMTLTKTCSSPRHPLLLGLSATGHVYCCRVRELRPRPGGGGAEGASRGDFLLISRSCLYAEREDEFDVVVGVGGRGGSHELYMSGQGIESTLVLRTGGCNTAERSEDRTCADEDMESSGGDTRGLLEGVGDAAGTVAGLGSGGLGTWGWEGSSKGVHPSSEEGKGLPWDLEIWHEEEEEDDEAEWLMELPLYSHSSADKKVGNMHVVDLPNDDIGLEETGHGRGGGAGTGTGAGTHLNFEISRSFGHGQLLLPPPVDELAATWTLVQRAREVGRGRGGEGAGSNSVCYVNRGGEL